MFIIAENQIKINIVLKTKDRIHLEKLQPSNDLEWQARLQDSSSPSVLVAAAQWYNFWIFLY